MTGTVHQAAARARHLEHWQLEHEPFRPQLRWPEDRRSIYQCARWQEAIARIEYVSEHQFGLAIVSGPAGTGKSLLLQAATETLAHENLATRLHRCRPTQQPLITPFGPTACWELQQQFSSGSPLQIPLPGNRPRVLLLDDLHLATLTTAQLQSAIEQVLQSPQWGCLILAVPAPQTTTYFDLLSVFAPLMIRLSALESWESSQYLQHRFRQAGGQTLLCEEAAAECLHHHSQGIPRWLNRIAHECLLMAAAQNMHEITQELVEQTVRGLRLDSTPATPASSPQLARQIA